MQLLECSALYQESARGEHLCSVSVPFFLLFHLPALNFLYSVLGQFQRLLESLRHLVWARVPSSYFKEKYSFSLLKLEVIMCLRKILLGEEVMRRALRHFEAKLLPAALCEHLVTTFT